MQNYKGGINMHSDKILSEDTLQAILEIEKRFNKIQQKSNTSNALDYLQEIIDYLRNTYNVK
jgi:hypothetical protein